MAKKLKIKNWNQRILNDATYVDYYNRLKNYAISMFKWTGLPDTVDPRFIELILFDSGNIVFFEDEKLKAFLCLQSANSGPFNVYNVPTRRHIFASNGYSKHRDNTNSVIIWNNFLRLNTAKTIHLYAERLTRIERAIDTNIEQQKTPYIVLGEESEMLTLKNLMSKVEGNERIIFGSNALNLDSIKSLPTVSPFNADKLQVLKRTIWNEAMTFLGISNSNSEKKERMITDEISSNLEQVEQSRNDMLKSRKEACRQINKMFGLNIDVEFSNKDMNYTSKTIDVMEAGGLDE